MPSLKQISPELVAELQALFIRDERQELAEQVSRAVVARCSYADDDDLGYVYLVRPEPSLHFSKLATPVAETVSFYAESGLNVDVDHDGNLFGIEYIGRRDVAISLKAGNVL